MRRLFLVIAKLTGLLQLNSTVITLISIGYTTSRIDVFQEWRTAAAILVPIALSIGLAWVLIIRTEWLADQLMIQDCGGIEGLEKHPMMQIGVKLIGVYVTVLAIPSVTRELIDPRTWSSQGSLDVLIKIIPNVLRLILGLFLTLNTEKVIEMISRKKEPTGQTTASYS